MLATLNTVQRMCGQGGAAAAPGGAPVAPKKSKKSKKKSKSDFNVDEVNESDDDDDEEEDEDGMDVSEAAALVKPLAGGGVDSGARVHAGRTFTLRDLLRWARRLEKLRKPELSLLRKGKSGADSLPPKVRVAAYEEAADVLAGMLPAGPGRRRVLEAMAACWGLGADAAEHMDLHHKPALQAGSGAIAVGRAVLPAEVGGCCTRCIQLTP
jgi:hypothetical protein